MKGDLALRLCSLEMQGFKSFPDKTYLEFDDGITAVVGPNGSGKSNIADAVRWVLGEQSTKTLRGGKMEDVIFSGTQNRKPVGYASVKLTVENINETADGQGEKTTIGRRLYRSGESEYRINSNIVRLRDVHELFMDTGLGRDGYSIIGQGKISEIVSARSNQRREIFEEAAGISKYRYRRTDALKRLEDADENLVRLNDILLELEDRVGPLKIQSEKAKKYLVLAEERKELEISLWVNNLNVLKNKIAQEENKVLISRNDYRNLEMEGESIEKELEQVYENMQQLTVSTDERRKLIRSIEETIANHDATIAVCKNDIHHNTLSLERLEGELSSAGKSTEELKQILEEKTQLYTTKAEENSILKEEIEKQKSVLIDELDKNNQLQIKLDGLKARQESLKDALNQIKLQQAGNESLFEESSDRLKDLQTRGSQYDSITRESYLNVTHCKEEIENQKEKINSLENTKTGYTLKRDSRAETYNKIVSEISKLENQLQQTENRATLLQDMEASMEGYMGSVKYILNQSKKGGIGGVHGAISSIINTQPEYITAIETALGGAMQNLVVKDENAAKRGIEMLKQANAGRATFLPLTSVKGTAMNFSSYSGVHGFIGGASTLVDCDPAYRGVVDQLLGRVLVVDDLNTGTAIARQGGYRFRIVTLDGQVINAGGSFTGGTASRSAGVLSRRNEITHLEKQTANIKKKITDFNPDLSKAKDELSALDATLVGASAEIQSAQEELVHLNFSLEQLESNYKTAKENQELAEKELENLVSRLEKLKDGRATAKQLVDENNEKLAQLDSEIVETAEKQKALIDSSNNSREGVSAKERLLLVSQQEQETLAQELDRLNNQAKDTETHRAGIQQESLALEEKNQASLKQITQLEEEKEQLNVEIVSHTNGIQELTEKRGELERSTTELRANERKLSHERENISRELARLEERKIGMQTSYDGLIAKLWDEYQLTFSIATQQATALDDPDESQKRLTNLRNKIRALGSINVDAIEEYKEVGERYEFLSAQVKDVEHSKAKLTEMIDELTTEMRDIFTENFQKISDEFAVTFVELFGGGRAKLTLTEGEDVLEAGVNIHVQPPGKVIKNLSLLSGGEQAFVAIAIYFAILKVKPAPFVLLDEIEAALDDVNVVKYASYLKGLSTDIQFIAITHRRGTMEEADVLYGVTMQEEGVSKLLELNINEIESKLGMEAEN